MPDGPALAEVDLFSPTPSDWSFEFQDAPPAASGTEPAPRQGRLEARVPVHVTYDDASLGSTLDALGPGQDEVESADDMDISEYLSQGAVCVLDEIESTLRDDREEALLHGEVSASEPAVATSRRIAAHIADRLALSPGLKWAAFGEDTGGVSLVLRSVLTDRRLDFRISADGLHISAVYIDEDLSARSVPLAIDDRSSLRESAAWVHGRP